MGVSLRINPADLTLGDLSDFEEYVGKSLEKVLKPVKTYDDDGVLVVDDKGRPVLEPDVPTKAVIGLVWIVNRRLTPGFTVNDARNVKVDELEIEVPDDDPETVGND